MPKARQEARKRAEVGVFIFDLLVVVQEMGLDEDFWSIFWISCSSIGMREVDLGIDEPLVDGYCISSKPKRQRCHFVFISAS